MEFYEVVKKRYSVRNYQPRPIEADKLQRISMAIQQAPSARNNQQCKFYFVSDIVMKQKLQVAAKNQPFVSQAGIVVVGVGTNPEHIMSCGHAAYCIDAAIALEHVALAAVAEGLGTCWIGAFYRDQVVDILGLPVNEIPVEMMTLGYPADSWQEKPRKAIQELVFPI